ncbi:MAG: hypothetical protein ACE5IZ_04965 [Dehalococcoidia bacterium]
MSKFWLFGAAAFVIALMVGGIAIALVTSRGSEELPAGSPEGVVQRYLRAIADEEYEEAYGYLSAEIQARCDYDQFLRFSSVPYLREELAEAQVTLESVRIVDDRAQVRARFTEVSPGGPLGVNEYSYERTYHLKREGEAWRLGTIPEVPRGCPPF